VGTIIRQLITDCPLVDQDQDGNEVTQVHLKKMAEKWLVHVYVYSDAVLTQTERPCKTEFDQIPSAVMGPFSSAVALCDVALAAAEWMVCAEWVVGSADCSTQL